MPRGKTPSLQRPGAQPAAAAAKPAAPPAPLPPPKLAGKPSVSPAQVRAVLSDKRWPAPVTAAPSAKGTVLTRRAGTQHERRQSRPPASLAHGCVRA